MRWRTRKPRRRNDGPQRLLDGLWRDEANAFLGPLLTHDPKFLRSLSLLQRILVGWAGMAALVPVAPFWHRTPGALPKPSAPVPLSVHFDVTKNADRRSLTAILPISGAPVIGGTASGISFLKTP